MRATSASHATRNACTGLTGSVCSVTPVMPCMGGVEPTSIEPIAGHPGLLRLYIDRIVAAADISRLGDQRVADAARRAVGAHDELCPVLSRLLPRGNDP